MAAERDAYIHRMVAEGPDDWLNAGIEPALLSVMLDRCFVEEKGLWLRRPTLNEIRAVSTPPQHGAIYPCNEVYDRIEVPLFLIWARYGLSAEWYDELETPASNAPNRTLLSMEASHNVPMQKPPELAELILTSLSAEMLS